VSYIVSHISWCSVQNVKITNLHLEGGKLENLRKGVQNAVSVLDINVILWEGHGDI